MLGAIATVALVVAANICCSASASPTNFEIENHKADVTVKTCRWLRNDKSNNVTRFSALPGGGWDNLRNMDMGKVADTSFSECELSDDGQYALPSNVILLVRKTSAVEVMSEIMNHFNNYSSTVSRSINVEASSQFFGINGKLSDEFQHVKSVAIGSKTKIGRTQLRYLLYTAKLQPDFRLSKAFVSRMSDIVNAIASNRTKLARYLSDLVVRDFGTHVITTVDAGGVLEKTDFINTDALNSKEFTNEKLSASMSLSFFSLLKMSADMNYAASKQNIETYEKSVSKMSIKSHGGPILGANPSLDDWLRGLKENLVPMDVHGEPLHAIIGRRSLPDMPVIFLLKLRKHIEEAVTRYYSANVVKGCQDPNSANFDPVANLDGHCEAPATNFSFGGVYQTCTETYPWLGACSDNGATLRNPITGSFSCPRGYEEVPLFTTTGRTIEQCTRKTTSCYLFFTCDDGESCERSTSYLNAFWCAARRGVRLQPSSGMIYGGAYATDGRFINEVTQAASCRELFKPYTIGRGIVLCLSMDLQSAARYRLPFAGFFSCHNGNPLAEPNRGLVASSRGRVKPEAPKQCPDGFSQVTLDSVDGCAIMQCVKGRSGLSRLPIRRPPFEEPDSELIERPVTRVESHGWAWDYNLNNNSWNFLGFFGTDNNKNAIRLQASAVNDPHQTSSTTKSAVNWTPTILAVCCIVGLVVGFGLAKLNKRALIVNFTSRLRRRNQRETTEQPDDEEISRRSEFNSARRRRGYGAVDSGADDLLACSSQDVEDDDEDEEKLVMDDEVEVVSKPTVKGGR